MWSDGSFCSAVGKLKVRTQLIREELSRLDIPGRLVLKRMNYRTVIKQAPPIADGTAVGLKFLVGMDLGITGTERSLLTC